jgi:hypothetical protein
VSEELENSLQQAIETYLNDRLRSIDEQVSRLQTEVNEALAQLRESSNAQSLDGTNLSAAIFAHLQTARGQKLTGADVSAPVPQDAATIKRAVSDIEAQQTQTEILKSLLKGAVHFTERVALFVIKNDQAIGWRVCEANDPTNLELIGGVSIPLSAETILTRAVRARGTWSGDPRASSEDQMLIDQIGGSPQMGFSIPLTVRGKVVAVLYADSSSSDSAAINLDALEILVRVAAMAVNLVSVHRAAPEPRPETTAVRTEPATKRAAEVESTYAPQVESTYAPQVEAQIAEPEPQPAPVETAEVSAPVEITPEEIPAAEAVAEEPPEQLAAEPEATVEPSAPEAPPEPEPIRKPADSVWSESVVQSSTPPPAFVSEYSTPLGSTRRFGVSEPDLPIEVSEEERRLHNDARRFARLLVSEIKLYNEPKVKEGRSHGDLYDRLREDIDRSRQMYDKRVAPPVAARHDYFHQELVNMLAEGDPAKLGGSYPGAVAN